MCRKFSLSSQNLIFVASIYFATILNVALWRFLFENIQKNELSDFLFFGSVFVVIFGLFLVFFNLCLVKYLTKPLLCFLLVVSAVANDAMWTYGIFIDSDMFRNAVETDFYEIHALATFENISLILISGVLPACLLLYINVTYMSFLQEIKRRAFQIGISLIVLAGLFGLFSKEYMSFCRNHSEVQKLMNPFNYICSSIRYYKKELFKKRPFVILDAEPSLKTTEDQPRLVVMIVGETARASAFSLYGYERDTNPNLSKRTNLAVLNDVSSCGTATTVSLPCIFSAKQRPDFNVSEAKITQNLIDLAQLAGYDVLWLENDGGCKDVCNRVPTKDMRQIGDEKLCSSGGCYDEILFQGLEEKLSDLKQNTLIVLHMMGSHGPTYFERYPEQFQKFRPTCDTGDLKECTQQQIQNTYDNTILYTDYIIDQTIQKLENVSSHQTALVYVSDHGESLGENHIYLHGLPYRIAPANQTKVPLLLWFSKDFATRNRIDINSLQKSAQARNLSHDNLFHTMLDLLNVQSSVYQPSLDVLAFDPK